MHEPACPSKADSNVGRGKKHTGIARQFVCEPHVRIDTKHAAR